jgi:hypothetical protein
MFGMAFLRLPGVEHRKRFGESVAKSVFRSTLPATIENSVETSRIGAEAGRANTSPVNPQEETVLIR